MNWAQEDDPEDIFGDVFDEYYAARGIVRPRIVKAQECELFMSPQGIREKFNRAPDVNKLLLGVDFTNGMHVVPEEFDLYPGNSLLLRSSGYAENAWRGGYPSMLTELFTTHNERVSVFGIGEQKQYYPNYYLYNHPNFIDMTDSVDRMQAFWDSVAESVQTSRKLTVVSFNDLDQLGFAWGTMRTPRPEKVVTVIETQLAKLAGSIVLIGACADKETEGYLSRRLRPYFKKEYTMVYDHKSSLADNFLYFESGDNQIQMAIQME